MRSNKYPSDVTDEQWALIEPLIPVYSGGRPRKTNLRDVVDAIFYLLRTRCQWRFLSKDFPPKSTVWRYFDQGRQNGTRNTIHDTLRDQVRNKEKPRRPRTTASIDSQSVDTSSGGEATGRDNAKNVDGRKRHLIGDSLGLLLAVLVTAARLDDGVAAPQVLEQLQRQHLPKLRRLLRAGSLLVQVRRLVRTSIYQPGMGHWPNLLRETRAEYPDHVWVADSTSGRVQEEFLFLAVLMDWYTRAIRGWQLGRTLGEELTYTAWEQALTRHRASAIHPSDHGLP